MANYYEKQQSAIRWITKQVKTAKEQKVQISESDLYHQAIELFAVPRQVIKDRIEYLKEKENVEWAK